MIKEFPLIGDSYWLLFLPLLLLHFSCSPTGRSPDSGDLEQRFITALYKGDLMLVDSCLRAGVDVHMQDINEVPAIIIAANSGNLEVVKKLLASGAKVNDRSSLYYNSTALMEIAVNGDVEMAKLLIENGADLHLKDTFGDPAINWAAYYGDIPLVDLLIKNGAKWEVQTEHGGAIEVAMKHWNDPLLNYFIEIGAGEQLQAEAQALVVAVREGSTDLVRNLLQKGASPDQTDELGTPILINAASRGDLPTVSLLTEVGADVDLMNRVGQTAIARAAYFTHEAVVQELLQHKANVNLTDEHYRLSPLISAAAGGVPSIGRLLIEAGAELDHQEGESGLTALMMATAYRHQDFVQVLLEAGANPYIKTNEGTTLSDMVSYSNNPRIAEMIQEYLMKH